MTMIERYEQIHKEISEKLRDSNIRGESTDFITDRQIDIIFDDYMNEFKKEYFMNRLDSDEIGFGMTCTILSFNTEAKVDEKFEIYDYSYTVVVNHSAMDQGEFKEWLKEKYELIDIKNKIERINDAN